VKLSGGVVVDSSGACCMLMPETIWLTCAVGFGISPGFTRKGVDVDIQSGLSASSRVWSRDAVA
jgi:hypothetical protein